jgi:hypothetical protein
MMDQPKAFRRDEGGGMTPDTEGLEAYDDAMLHCQLTGVPTAPEEMATWAAVLRELQARGRVRLLSGSFEDIGKANIRRLRE